MRQDSSACLCSCALHALDVAGEVAYNEVLVAGSLLAIEASGCREEVLFALRRFGPSLLLRWIATTPSCAQETMNVSHIWPEAVVIGR